MSVGVVIVNHDQKDLLRACLLSWRRDGMAAEILVSDNRSTDGSQAMLAAEFPEVGLLQHDPEIGFAAAANAGLKALAARHAWVFLTTDDTEIEPGMLAALLETAGEDPRIAALGPKVLVHGSNVLWHAGGRIHPFFGNPGHFGFGYKDDGAFDQARDCLFVSGCGLFLRSAAAEPLGFLRPELGFYAEDSDLCLRLREDGWRVVYAPKARMSHHVSASLGLGSPLSAYYITRNSLALLRRHRISPWGPLSLLAFVAVVLPWRCAKALWIAPQKALAFWRAVILGVKDFALGRYGLRDPRDLSKPVGRAA